MKKIDLIVTIMYVHTQLSQVYKRPVKLSLREVRSNHQSELYHSLIFDLSFTNNHSL